MSENTTTEEDYTIKPSSKADLAQQLFEHWDAIVEITKDLPVEKRMNAFYDMLELTGNKDVIYELEKRISKRDDWLDSFLPDSDDVREHYQRLVDVIRFLSYIDNDEDLITSKLLEIFSTVSCWHDGLKDRPDKFDMTEPVGGINDDTESKAKNEPEAKAAS